MKERKQFVREHLRGEHCVSELCRRFGISRKTGPEWLGRFYAEGGSGPLPSPTEMGRGQRLALHPMAEARIRHERIAPGKPQQNDRHELLGLDPIETDTWDVYFGSVLLGRVERPSGGRFRLRFVRCS